MKDYTVFSPSKETFTVSAETHGEAVRVTATYFPIGSEFVVGTLHYHKYETEKKEEKVVLK